MKRSALLAVLLCGCPNLQTGKVDPYLTARTIIYGAQTSLSLADGILAQWLLGQRDDAAKNRAMTTYHTARAGVAGSLQLALNGVSIAEQAKQGVDAKALLGAANEAWQTLRKTLEDVLQTGVPADIVVVKAVDPGTPGTLKSALTTKGSPVDQLPKSLID